MKAHHFIACALLTLGLVGLAEPAHATPYQADIGADWCRTTAEPGTLLETIRSRLDWQSDGNLALYDSNGTYLWGTGFTGNDLELCFQPDGNLVIYRSGAWLWQSYTVGGPASRLHLDGCSLSVRDGNGATGWESGSVCGGYRAEMQPGWCRTTAQAGTLMRTDDGWVTWQDDGHLVVYDRAGNFMWGTGVIGQQLRLCFQDDGNMVVYDNAQAVWQSYTTAGPSSRLRLEGGRLSIADANGNPLWGSASRTEPIRSATAHKGWCRSTAEHAVLLRTDEAYLAWQADGNLALYGVDGVHRWSSATHGQADRLCFQDDGNLVIYAAGNQPIWDTASQGGTGDRMVLDGCTLSLLGGPTMWTTGFACPGTARDEIGARWCRGTHQPGVILENDDAVLRWQSDGHLALYDRDGTFKWGSHTVDPNSQLCFQDDGNLVVYQNGHAAWNSGTTPGPDARLALDACTVSVLDGNRDGVWSDGAACTSTVDSDRVGKGWCRTTAMAGTILQTPYARLDWQPDGNLALYDHNGAWQWDAGTAAQATRLCFQDDGNFILYDGDNALWHTSQYGAMGPTLSLNGCTLAIDGQPWSLGFECSAGGGHEETHSKSDSWSQGAFGQNFGAGYDASITYQRPHAGLSRTLGEATATAQIFSVSRPVLEASAVTTHTAGGGTAYGSLSVLGISTPVAVITAERAPLLDPIERDFFSLSRGFKIGPLDVDVSGTVTGRLTLEGRLIPRSSGAALELVPRAQLDVRFSGSAGKVCVNAGVGNTVHLIDAEAPLLASVDFVNRVFRLLGRVDVRKAYGHVDAYVEYCLSDERWKIFDFGNDQTSTLWTFIDHSSTF